MRRAGRPARSSAWFRDLTRAAAMSALTVAATTMQGASRAAVAADGPPIRSLGSPTTLGGLTWTATFRNSDARLARPTDDPLLSVEISIGLPARFVHVDFVAPLSRIRGGATRGFMITQPSFSVLWLLIDLLIYGALFTVVIRLVRRRVRQRRHAQGRCVECAHLRTPAGTGPSIVSYTCPECGYTAPDRRSDGRDSACARSLRHGEDRSSSASVRTIPSAGSACD